MTEAGDALNYSVLLHICDLSVFLQSLNLSLVTLYPPRDKIPILDIAHIEGKVSPKLFQTLSQCYIISKTNGTCFSLFTYSTIILVVKITFLINCKFCVHALCNQMLSFALIISIYQISRPQNFNTKKNRKDYTKLD